MRIWEAEVVVDTAGVVVEVDITSRGLNRACTDIKYQADMTRVKGQTSTTGLSLCQEMRD